MVVPIFKTFRANSLDWVSLMGYNTPKLPSYINAAAIRPHSRRRLSWQPSRERRAFSRLPLNTRFIRIWWASGRLRGSSCSMTAISGMAWFTHPSLTPAGKPLTIKPEVTPSSGFDQISRVLGSLLLVAIFIYNDILPSWFKWMVSVSVICGTIHKLPKLRECLPFEISERVWQFSTMISSPLAFEITSFVFLLRWKKSCGRGKSIVSPEVTESKVSPHDIVHVCDVKFFTSNCKIALHDTSVIEEMPNNAQKKGKRKPDIMCILIPWFC